MQAVGRINQFLRYQQPLLVATGSILGMAAVSQLSKLFDSAHQDWLWERATYRLLQISPLKEMFQEKIDKQFVDSSSSARKKWAPFGNPVREIPEEGMRYEELTSLVNKYSALTLNELKNRHFSGTIYSKSLDGDPKPISFPEAPKDLAERLEALFTGSFQRAYLWNSLHSGEFPIGSFLEYQVIQMTAEMFGGKDAVGIVTSGGTESLMTAAKGYRNWGLQRGIALGQSVIVAPDSIHASLMKAAEDYHINLVLVPTDETGQVHMKDISAAVDRHGSNVVALFGSAPSYPKGKIDPIAEMSKLAKEKGIGFHADCCLGGFIVNFHPEIDGDFLRFPGITSLSVDTHKNGWAPKGSSVLIAQDLPDGKNLAHHFIYAIPSWSGGVYGTPRTAGSQSSVPALHAFLAMMAIGKNGYRQTASSIVSAAQEIADSLEKISGLKLLGNPDLNVVAFKVDPDLGLMEGATYAFAKEMADRGFVLNTLRGDAVHFCVTGRFAADQSALKKFEAAAKESLEATKALNALLIEKEVKFSGEAGIYCALEAAINPNREELGWTKYIENRLFGQAGARAAVKTYFLAFMNPWRYFNHTQRVP